MKDIDDTGESSEALDTVLRRGLKTDPLSSEAMQRIRAATESEWKTAAGIAEATRWRFYASAAAALLLVLGSSLFVVWRNPAIFSTPVLSRLDRMEYPGVSEQHAWTRDRSLASGEVLLKGQRLLARGAARIALPGAGSIRIAAGTRLKVASDSLIILKDGDLYVDVPPTASHELHVVVQTPAGSFAHVGTQFQVAVHAGTTEVRVREGRVRWSSAAGDTVAAAGTQILIDDHGTATTSRIQTTGSAWLWAEMLADTFEIDNRSLTEFLRYFARETGRSLVFADAAAERRANETKLHGTVQKLSPVEALSAVMATTSLRFRLDAGSIRIESAGDMERKIK